MSIVRPVSPVPATAKQGLTDPSIPRPRLWQKGFARDVLPFMTSLSFHVGLVGVGLLTYTAIHSLRTPTPVQTIVPDSPLIDANVLGYLGDDAERPWTSRSQVQFRENTDAMGMSSFASASKVNLGSNGGGEPNENTANVFQAGLGSIGRGGTFGTHDGNGNGSGTGDGKLAPWGIPNRGGDSHATFTSTRYAHHLVFLCDATGSMLNKMATLKEELTKSVNGLRPSQTFDILFFQGNNVLAFEKSLTPATPENKRKAGLWLDGVSSQDITNPIPALETALRLQPEVLYFLTDAADFPDTNAVLSTIEKHNVDRKIKLHTILFVEDKIERDKNVDSEGLMKKIASDSGGTFRWVQMDAIENK